MTPDEALEKADEARQLAQSTVDAARQTGRKIPPAPPPPFSGENGGSPHNGPMEARMAVIENRLDHIDKEVSQVKWWVAGSTLTIILTMVATVIGTGVAIQQMTVATFQGAAQVSKESAAAAQPTVLPPIIINVPSTQPAPAAPAAK